LAKFIVTYHGLGHPDPAEMESARKDFMAWLGSAGPAVVDPGAPVAFAGQVSAGASAPVADIVGYSVMEAESVEAVKELLTSHPFVARGGTLQINQAMA
jgi:hypothetical protein